METLHTMISWYGTTQTWQTASETCINVPLDCFKTLTGVIPEIGERNENDLKLEEATRTCVSTFRKHMDNLQFFHALEALQVLIQEGNRYIQVEQPWKLMKIGQEERCGQVMRYALEVCRGHLGCSIPINAQQVSGIPVCA